MSCCGKKFIITEEDRKHILSLYGLIQEEDPKPQSETSTSTLKFDKTINFAPGYYRHKGPVTTKAGTTYDWDVDKTLNADLQKIKEFLKNNPTGYVVEVNLYSGESKIPNNDNEQGGAQVKENHLNDARLNSLKSYLNPIFETWKTEGITKTDFKINEYKNIGETAWVGTPFCPANTTDERACTTTYYNKVKAGDKTALEYKDKYDKEQYFRVIIEVKKVETPQPQNSPSVDNDNVSEGCATGLEVVIYVKSHNCQNAEYLVYANNTLLTNLSGGFTANLNNAGGKLKADNFNFPAPDDAGAIYQTTEDGTQIGFMYKTDDIPAQALNPSYGYTKNGPYSANKEGDIRGQRLDTFKVNATQSKTITEQGNGEINIWLIGTTKAMHLDIPYVLIKKDGKEVYNNQPKIEQGLVLTLSGCGNKVLPLSTKGIKPTGYESILINVFKERFDKIKQGLGANAIEELSKKQLKDSKSQLLDRTTNLMSLINQVISMGYEIYKRTIEKDTGNAGYKKFKTEWDLQGNKVARMNIYNQIQIILDESPSYRKNEDGTYVDPNIEKSKKNPEKTLMGDIYMKLQKFYEKYDIFYKNVDGQYLQNGLTYADAEAKDGGMGPLTGRQYVTTDWSTGEQVDTIV
jgi:hypothetical protein